jgi:PAS domain S-box-containing protein
VGIDQAEQRLERSEERFRLLVETVQDYAMFLLDPSGNIASWNAGAERIKGYRADEIIGRHFSVFYPPDVVARGWPEHELKVAAEVGRFEDEGWRLRKDGTRFWANVVITALHSPDGTLLGFAKVTRDLTERRRHEEDLRRSEERFRLMVDAVQDYAIFMLDPEGHVASWNGGAQRIKGYAPDEIIGKYFGVFYLPTRWRAAGRSTSWPWRARRAASRTRAGACARTAHASGPTW